jgi:hypothetical protein
MKPGRVIAALALAFAAAANLHAQPAECVADLEALAPYMMANDAGARDHLAQKGQAAFDAALSKARTQALASGSDAECLAALRTYLLAFRKNHLGLRDLTATGSARVEPSPSFRVLSAETALLVVPTFADPAGAPLAALVKEHRAEIESRPNLVIDVRGNSGGSDWTYEPLVALAEANIRRDVGAQLLATPANSTATRAACALFAPGSVQCREATAAAADAMDRAAPGTIIPIPGEPAVEIVEPKRVLERPRRIGVLVDSRCGSSCEEFLLVMRQSFKVKLFGQSSAGSLDYSNLRPWTLPSGKRRLMYATTRSLRLPQFAVDAAGIPPDQVFPAPVDAAAKEAELREVQRVLESGAR